MKILLGAATLSFVLAFFEDAEEGAPTQLKTQARLKLGCTAAQARRCREKYFAAVLSRPISWFRPNST